MPFQPYNSEFMRVQVDSARGVCYSIAYMTEYEKQKGNSTIQVGQILFSKIEIGLSIKNQIFSIQR